MKYYYDLHVHTALSPCCDDDATPHNIVGIAALSGLDILAITDHNSAANAKAVMQVAKKVCPRLLVIAGIELTTSEEIHILLLFPSIEAAQAAQAEIDCRRFTIKNKPSVYGNQFYFDAHDNIIKREETLLVTATEISANEAYFFAARYGGVAVPAHIDRPAYAMIAVLGEVPDALGYGAVEMTSRAPDALRAKFWQKGYHILTDSDSHALGIMNDRSPQNAIELPECSAQALIDKLSKRRVRVQNTK